MRLDFAYSRTVPTRDFGGYVWTDFAIASNSGISADRAAATKSSNLEREEHDRPARVMRDSGPCGLDREVEPVEDIERIGGERECLERGQLFRSAHPRGTLLEDRAPGLCPTDKARAELSIFRLPRPIQPSKGRLMM
jgi:hypothetical protein